MEIGDKLLGVLNEVSLFGKLISNIYVLSDLPVQRKSHKKLYV